MGDLPGLWVRILTLMIACLGLVSADPDGARIINGQVSLSYPDPSTLNVTNTPGSIINWQQFSIQR